MLYLHNLSCACMYSYNYCYYFYSPCSAQMRTRYTCGLFRTDSLTQTGLKSFQTVYTCINYCHTVVTPLHFEGSTCRFIRVAVLLNSLGIITCIRGVRLIMQARAKEQLSRNAHGQGQNGWHTFALSLVPIHCSFFSFVCS